MTCKPTAGEVRVLVNASIGLLPVPVLDANGALWRDCRSRIVEVAPANRARVTAGPPWCRL